MANMYGQLDSYTESKIKRILKNYASFIKRQENKIREIENLSPPLYEKQIKKDISNVNKQTKIKTEKYIKQILKATS